jgi:hypothetical protein
VAERTFHGTEEYDDSTLSHCAAETILAAHGGKVGEDYSDHEATLWARIPILEAR